MFPFNAGSCCKAFSLGNDQLSSEILSVLPQKLIRKQENVMLVALEAGGVQDGITTITFRNVYSSFRF